MATVRLPPHELPEAHGDFATAAGPQGTEGYLAYLPEPYCLPYGKEAGGVAEIEGVLQELGDGRELYVEVGLRRGRVGFQIA